MKKLLIVLSLGAGYSFAVSNPATVDYNTYLTPHTYTVPSLSTQLNGPNLPGNGWLEVTNPNNGLNGRNAILQTEITESGSMASRVRNETTLVWGPWYVGTTSGSISLALPNTDIFVGNASNAATAVAVSGAMTLANTGVFTPVTASFFTTPSTGSTNNVLTGGQTRAGSAAFTSIAGNSSQSVSVTYGTACTTAAYSVQLTTLEATVNLPVTAKLKSQTASGFVAEVDNESATATASGTLFYTTNCH